MKESAKIRKTDYAQMRHMEAWLRHPVLGDPSFDNFTKLGETVHRSEAPFEWAVNGSIFSDPKTGCWYYYVARYPRDYFRPGSSICHFIIYRSRDKGLTWENLGRGFPNLDCPFRGLEGSSMGAPDVAVTYDEAGDKYWLTYDWGAGRLIKKEDAESGFEIFPDAGVAMAWAERPEGPFHLLDTWVHNNRFPSSRIGRFNRGYSSSAFKRKNDWICFIMQDSGPYYGWGLTCRTAKTPDGEWSKPRLLLSPDRPEYYPAILEYCFCVERGGKIYAPATSVAGNRNYQVVFAADLEEAEYPSAWKMIREGSLWHSRPVADERYGIWGQTLQGFVEDGKYYTMYVGMDERNCGTMSVASCPVEQPFKDGFTISGHVGKSVSPILAAYRDFKLRAQMEFTGTVEVFLKYHGIMGPDQCTSNCVTSGESFCSSVSVECDDRQQYRVLLRDPKGSLRVLHTGCCGERIRMLEAEWTKNHLSLSVNQKRAWDGDLSWLPEDFDNAPLAICAHEVSVLDCSCFEVEGTPLSYALRYSAREGVLAAMHRPDWKSLRREEFLTEQGYIGDREKWVKWNFHGDGFRIYAPKGPDLGRAEIWVDGYLFATVELYSQREEASAVVYEESGLPGETRHTVVVRGYEGQAFAVDILEVTGKPAVD